MSTSHLHFKISSIAVAMTVVAFGLAIPSQAQADTNSVLYQQGMDITGQLTLLHEANGSQAKKVRNAPAITNRLPRHVFQKAREVLIKVQVSRKLNGHFVGSRRTVRRYPRNCPQCSGGRYQHRRRHLDNHPSDPFSPRIGQVSGQVLSRCRRTIYPIRRAARSAGSFPSSDQNGVTMLFR